MEGHVELIATDRAQDGVGLTSFGVCAEPLQWVLDPTVWTCCELHSFTSVPFDRLRAGLGLGFDRVEVHALAVGVCVDEHIGQVQPAHGFDVQGLGGVYAPGWWWCLSARPPK